MTKTLPSSVRFACLVVVCLLPFGLAAQTQSPAKPATDQAAKVDLNSATKTQLEQVPGVTASTAKQIITGRPYTAVGDLAKAGVAAKTITAITPYVMVGPAVPAAAKTSSKSKKTATSATPVNLNTATDKELETLPGVGPATAKKIIAARPFTAVSDLSKAGLSQKTITKLTPLVTVGKSAPTR